MDNIRGKTIAVTGAARGIGYATARALLARGARVVIGDRDVARLESAVADLSGVGMISGHPLDVTDAASFATFVDKARADGAGHLDVVMPPFTNTELISGTSGVAANRAAEPEDIAAAITRVLDKPKTHVSVPGGLRFILGVTTMLGPRGRWWLNRRTGTDRVFLEFDVAARNSYEERARAATGVVGDEGDGSNR